MGHGGTRRDLDSNLKTTGNNEYNSLSKLVYREYTEPVAEEK